MNKLIIYFIIFYFTFSLLSLLFIYNLKPICIEKFNYGLERCPVIFYINLKHRIDRKESLINQIKKIHYPLNRVNRIDAIKKNNGALGCALSHILALEEAIKLNVDSALIFEDDFIWKENSDVVNKAIDNAYNDKNWQICLLTCNGKTKDISNKKICKVITCQTASAYIVRKKYMPKLLSFWKSYIKDDKLKLEIDQSWKILQRKDKWISTKPILGLQMPSYSDIEKKNVNYKV